MKPHQHIIPIDPSFGYDILAAWTEICIFGRRVTFTGTCAWATIECDGEMCTLIERDDA